MFETQNPIDEHKQTREYDITSLVNVKIDAHMIMNKVIQRIAVF